MTVAAVMTYDSLVNDIQTYLERTDTATLEKIPQFIMLAEQIISSQIKFLGNLTVNTSTMPASSNIIDKPARWHKTVSMNITVDGKRYPVKPLTSILIKPGCRHRAVGKMKIVNIPVPAFDPDDEWFD